MLLALLNRIKILVINNKITIWLVDFLHLLLSNKSTHYICFVKGKDIKVLKWGRIKKKEGRIKIKETREKRKDKRDKKKEKRLRKKGRLEGWKVGGD